MISLSCISVNLAIQFFTSKALRNFWQKEYGYDDKTTFMYIVLIEHVIILFKVLLASLISDVPAWVTEEEIDQ